MTSRFGRLLNSINIEAGANKMWLVDNCWTLMICSSVFLKKISKYSKQTQRRYWLSDTIHYLRSEGKKLRVASTQVTFGHLCQDSRCPVLPLFFSCDKGSQCPDVPKTAQQLFLTSSAKNFWRSFHSIAKAKGLISIHSLSSKKLKTDKYHKAFAPIDSRKNAVEKRHTIFK